MSSTTTTTKDLVCSDLVTSPSSGHQNQKSSNVSTSTTRMIRSFTLFDNRDFLPRPFQIELYEACKNRDTIVFLRPGQGKYFISVMLVKYFSPYKIPRSIRNVSVSDYNENFEDQEIDKKIFFLCKCTNSIRLYSSVFNAHSDLRIAEYLDHQEAMKWTREEWLAQLSVYDIHIMMAELFEYLLMENFVSDKNINLLILDDVHKILLKNKFSQESIDCYTRIVRKLNQEQNNSTKLKQKKNKHYRILGLSASILLEDVSSAIFETMIAQIESNLNCSCETYADLRMINKYSIQSRIKLRVFPPLMPLMNKNNMIDERKYRMALVNIRNYTGQFFQFITNFQIQLPQNVDQQYRQRYQNQQIINSDSLARIIIDLFEVYGTMGEWATLKLVEMVNRELFDTITLISKTQSNYLRLLNTAYSTMQFIRNCILGYLPKDISNKLDSYESRLNLEEFLSISSPKLHLLTDVMFDYVGELYRPQNTTSNQTSSSSSFVFPANICSLIYVENRSMARVLDEWLRELSAILTVEYKDSSSFNCFQFLMPDHVFLAEDDGQNELKNFYYRKHQKSLHEIYYYRQQEETLRKFRLAHNCNLLVTTSMSAEGLDVNRCNLVVCFDPPKTFHQFIQSKGRVRVEKGQFIVLVDQTNQKDYVEKFKEFCNIEKIFTKLVPLNNQVIIEQEPNISKLIKQTPIISKKLDERPLVSLKTEQRQPTGKSSERSSKNHKKHSTTISTSAGSTPSPVQLTLDNAISILNRYCNKLPSDTFTKLVPNYKIEAVEETLQDATNCTGDPSPKLVTKFRCRLYLPINSTYRDEIVGDLQPTQSLAKQSAAYQTVLTLKDIGELDQNYYPVGKETSRYIEKLGLQDCFINTKVNVPGIQNNQQNSQEQSGQTSAYQTHHTASHGHHHGHRHHHHHHPKGNRYNRIQNRNIASKRRQYYNKKVADSLRGEVFKFDSIGKKYYIQYLYQFDMKLTYSLSGEQNTRGRKIIDPAETSRTFGIIVPKYLPPICDFTIYNRSGEVTISLTPMLVTNTGHGLPVSEMQIKQIENFHQFTFENVLPLGKSSLRFNVEEASNGNYLIVPIDKCLENDSKTIDWKFIELIWKHCQLQLQSNDVDNEEMSTNSFDGQSSFIFEERLYQDAVVIPKYRKDKLQAFYYVAEICKDLTPLSPFPDNEYNSFEEYYRQKYGKKITNLKQPLLDVDHTSARLNLLTPRFLNRKGLTFHTAAKSACHHSKRSPQQKQILVPELCYIHPFPASFWRKAVGLPCILYRLNLLLVAEELRFKISKEANIGKTELPPGEKWPKLDFGWSTLVERAKLEQEGILQSLEIDLKQCEEQDKEATKSEDLDSLETTMKPEVSETINNDNINDPFSSMDDWSSFSTNLPAELEQMKVSQDDDNESIMSNEDFMPQIELISGPFEKNFLSRNTPPIHRQEDDHSYSDSEYSGEEDDIDVKPIVEVDNEGRPINKKQISKKTKIRPVRAGSPTYWKKQAESLNEDQVALKRFKEEDWTKWTAPNPTTLTNVSIETEFSLNIDDLQRELSDMMINKKIFPVENDSDNSGDFDDNGAPLDNYDDFDLGPEEEPRPRNKNRKKNKTPVIITSLSDLDEDEDEDDVNNTFSDLEFNDSSDDEDEEDFEDYDDEEDELIDDEDLDLMDDGHRRKQLGSHKRNQENHALLKNLSQTMNDYQMKSVIYDVLKIELLYDPKQIEERNLKYYYRQRFALADQEPEHLRKRKLFDEMYREEKKQVQECIQNVKEQMEHGQNMDGRDKNWNEGFHPEAEAIEFDSDLNELDLSEPLLEVLMKNINLEIVESIQNEMTMNNFEEPKRQMNDERILDTTESNILNQQPIKKMEVKFGELLPNRDADLVTLKTKSELWDFHRECALQTLPPWLHQSENDGAGGDGLGPHPSLILQAITMSNSSDGINLERLETVGDSFLKYSITAFLFCMCPELNEGKLSFLRSRQISNINLHRLGQRINLGQLMIASKFEPVDNWCPPSYQVVEVSTGEEQKVPYDLLTQHSIPNKSIADCVEALIGTYLISAGSQGAIQFMDWLGLKVLPKGMKIITKDDHHQQTSCSADLEFDLLSREKWLPQPRSPLIIPKHLRGNQQKVMEIEDKLQQTYYKHHLDRFEQILGYRFQDRAYLVQAFTHNSYYENAVTDCYQRLEFLGDAVLDYLVTRYLYEDHRRHSPGTLTDLRSALVNNTFFAALAVKYNFHKYLMMLSSELYRVIDGFVRKFNIYYNNNKQTSTSIKTPANQQTDDSANSDVDSNEFKYNYWELFISENEAEHLEDIEVPKALGDIFESVAGAIYLDSGMSLEAVWKAYYPMMKPEIENFSEKVPKSPIRVLLEKRPQSVTFGKPEITSGRRIRVTVEVFGLGKFVGIGRNKRIAKCTAAKRALRALESDNRRKDMERQRRLEETLTTNNKFH